MLLRELAATPSQTAMGFWFPLAVVLVGAVATYILTRIGKKEDINSAELKKTLEKMQQTLDEHGKALARQSEGLAVLVGRVGPMNDRLTGAEHTIAHLREATATLETELRLFQQYQKDTKEELLTRIASQRKGDVRT